MTKGRNFQKSAILLTRLSLKSAVLLTRLSLKSAVVIITLITMSGQSVDAGWGYVDQSGWSSLHNTSCGGKHQSPIDLPNVCLPINSNLTQVNPGLNLRLINYDMQMPPSLLSLRNNGHTAVLSLKDSRQPNSWLPKISGSVVGGDKYQLLQLHFHWDSNVRNRFLSLFFQFFFFLFSNFPSFFSNFSSFFFPIFLLFFQFFFFLFLFFQLFVFFLFLFLPIFSVFHFFFLFSLNFLSLQEYFLHLIILYSLISASLIYPLSLLFILTNYLPNHNLTNYFFHCFSPILPKISSLFCPKFPQKMFPKKNVPKTNLIEEFAHRKRACAPRNKESI